MKLSPLAILSITVGVSCAFVPHSSHSLKIGSLALSSETTPVNESKPAALPEVAFGWVPNPSKPCYGLPGAIEPLGFFDPLEFSKDKDLNKVKRLREAEVMHGRVAMMATLGYLVGEHTPTIVYGSGVPTIANNQLAEMPMTLLFPLFLFINFAEAWRAVNGWVEPKAGTYFQLREKYYPGGIGFDPLGMKPSDPKDFADLAAKELSNGRLAMIAVAGMCAQELVTGKPLF